MIANPLLPAFRCASMLLCALGAAMETQQLRPCKQDESSFVQGMFVGVDASIPSSIECPSLHFCFL